jgi:hypothetical protein
MIDAKLLPYVLRGLLDAQTARGGRFIESDLRDALTRMGIDGTQPRVQLEWLRSEGLVVEHTSIYDALTSSGVRLANTA